MSTAPPVLAATPYRLREHHGFESDGTRFLYLVPSGAIFAVNEIGQEIMECIRAEDRMRAEVIIGRCGSRL